MRKRALSLCMALILAASLITPAFAFTFPGAYWPLQDEWIKAADANDPDRIIAAAQKTYDLLIPYAPDDTVYLNLEFKCSLASWACETKGDLDNAILWLERRLEMDYWFTANGKDYTDSILNSQARLDYLKAARDVTVYALSDTSASPYKVGPSTGVWYGMPAGPDRQVSSATLLYLDFNDLGQYNASYWINYYRNSSPSFKQALNGGVIECAFNFEGSEIQDVLSADRYINETMAALGGLNATILLRIGAEVNNWDPTTFDADQYIQAFRKVASAARKYSNLQVVYSPDMVNDRRVTAATYYPGDEYVDWVGISAYHRTAYRNSNGVEPGAYDMDYRLRGSFDEDAWYGVGFYDYDPLVAMKHVADLAAAHSKPMMISECGFPNLDTIYGDTSNYAADQINKFYSYLTMVYPQIKAVFYFDSNRLDHALDHCDFSISNKPTLLNVYNSAIRNAGVYLDSAKGSVDAMWQPLDQTRLSEGSGTLRLATYVSFPNVADAEVKYYVDGALAGTSNKAPYYYELDTAKLSGGAHTVKVTAAGGQFRQEVSYTLTVPGKPVEPEKPTEPEKPDPEPAVLTAYPSTQTVTIDGKQVEFQMYSLKEENGNYKNYIKIRDLALALKGTDAQFDVGLTDGVITFTGGKDYTPDGSENKTPYSGEQTCTMVSRDINVNGTLGPIPAFVITDSSGGGYTYFQVQDIAEKLDFNVYWGGSAGIVLETDKPYTGSAN